jgi:peptidoglycan/LPS O-acetylase OafA/YrhL
LRHGSGAIQMNTIDSALAESKGIGKGFGHLRLALAAAILFDHCFTLSTGSAVVIGTGLAQSSAESASQTVAFDPVAWFRFVFLHKHNPDGHFALMLVPMFFALSGFLVTGSAYRTKTVTRFLAFRAIRIVPALFVEVSLSALLLGPILTIVPLSKYFSDPQFYEYFGNIIGRVRYSLPGLFLSNPYAGIVNGNLWTLPAEFYCYLIIGTLMVLGVLFRPAVFSVILSLALTVFIVFEGWFRDNSASDVQHYTATAVVFFFCGSLFFQKKELVPLNKWLFLFCAGLVYVSVVSTPTIHRWLEYGNLIALTYFTVYIGFLALPRIPVLLSGDYSYGMYLYGFPIEQSLVAIFDPLRGHPFYLLGAALPLTMIFAMLSWHFFEEPAMALKQTRLWQRHLATTSKIT